MPNNIEFSSLSENPLEYLLILKKINKLKHDKKINRQSNHKFAYENFSNDVLYFSELAIAGKQGMGVFLKLFSSVLDKAKTLKVKKVSMHARKNNGLSDLIQKRYKATFVRSESNFFGSGEDFDYLEILIN
jgi:hypothetical protein